MADHDYRTGGWKNKYVIFKRCKDCNGTGHNIYCNCRSVGECFHTGEPCRTCNGLGRVPVDPVAVYFVLRLDEDPHAVAAAHAYADSVQSDNPEFASDIRARLQAIPEAQPGREGDKSK